MKMPSRLTAAMMTMAMNPASFPKMMEKRMKPMKACADGTGGKGEEPPPDAHELQRLLQALEDGKAVERVVHSRGFCVCVVVLA
jgi:hypothetical protein